MQDSWSAPASVDDLQEAMASLGNASLRVSAARSALEAHLSHAPGGQPENWTVWVGLSDGASAALLSQPRRDRLSVLGWPVLNSVRPGRPVANGRTWVIEGREDVEKLHRALIEMLSVGADPIEPSAQLELSKQIVYDTAGYAPIGCFIALVSAVVGLVVGIVVAIIAGYPANLLDQSIWGTALVAGLLVGMVALMVATPSPRLGHPPSAASERALFAVAIAVPALVTLGAVLWLSIWSY